MFAPTTQKTSLLKALKLTRRDLRVFAVSAVMVSSIAAGAVTLTQPDPSDHMTGQMANNGICSAAKYFR